MGIAYVDCEACGCLIRAPESQCPFCGHHASVSSSAGGTLRIFGLAAGLAAATMSCAAENDMPNDSVGDASVNDDDNADAVTYAGPDDASITDPGETETTNPSTTMQPDPTDADAVTYAGPDESDSTVTSSDSGPDTETSSESGTSSGTDTASSGTDATSTGSSGTGDTDTNG
jgi:hypothetical protein